MAGTSGPDIVTDGLTLMLDAANRKSYPGSGTVWNDLSGNGYDSELKNGPTFNSNNSGNIRIDGSNDFVAVVTNGQNKFDIQTWAVDAWIRLSSLAADNVIFSYDNTVHSAPYYSTHMRTSASNKLSIGWNSNGEYTSLATDIGQFTTNTWYNVVGVYESGRQELYINGNLITSSTVVGTITYYAQEVWVGRANYASSYFNGDIASVKHYSKALTSAEITQNYNATKNRFI